MVVGGKRVNKSLQLSLRLAVRAKSSKSQATTILYGSVSVSLVQVDARIILSRSWPDYGFDTV